MSHRAKKSLGQNFLRSKSALFSIVSAGELSVLDTVLEIGPGTGVLTEGLLATGARVIAIEKDRDLIPLLSEKFASHITAGKLVLIEGDALLFDPADYKLKAGQYKLIANIPYYITGALFEKFLTGKNHPSRMVVLIQKEVATRIVARDNKESILSLSVKVFGTPKIVAKVPRTAFSPAPNVDSAVLSVSNISQKNFTKEATMKKFFTIVKAGFAHKRKLLSRNLETVAEKTAITKAFTELALSEKTRAEDLPMQTWLALSRSLG